VRLAIMSEDPVAGDEVGDPVRAVDVLGADTKKSAELPASLFDVQTNVPLIHQVVVAQQAAARQGTHSTKTRGDVRGGGIKPWRQKGTGRARAGTIRAPHFTGGGVAFPPTARNFEVKVNRKAAPFGARRRSLEPCDERDDRSDRRWRVLRAVDESGR